MTFSDDQRKLLSEKLLDLSNLVAVATIIGQLLARETRWVAVAAGILVVVAGYLYGIYLRK